MAEDAQVFGFPILLIETTRKITVNAPVRTRPGFGPSFTPMRANPPGDFRRSCA
jgi:hypothetical protein